MKDKIDIISPLETDYDWYRVTAYPLDDFFNMIDKVVTKYFYGFYHVLGRKFVEGALTPDELRFLAIQEYHYYASTTWWNAMKVAQSDTLDQQRLLHGPLLDELGNDLVDPKGEPAHSTLFLRYCKGLGLIEEDVISSVLVPSVILAVTELRRIAYERPLYEFLATSNLVVEKMRPLHYSQLLKTFSTHYNWVPQTSLKFYEVHAYLDSNHSSLGRKIIEQYVEDSKRDQDAVFSSILRSICLRLVMYDGIHSAMNDKGSIGLRTWPNFPKEPWPRPSSKMP